MKYLCLNYLFYINKKKKNTIHIFRYRQLTPKKWTSCLPLITTTHNPLQASLRLPSQVALKMASHLPPQNLIQ